jgi:hypothetical protein
MGEPLPQPWGRDSLRGPPMSHVLKELFGQFDWVQRSLIFIYVGLEQRPISYIYRPSVPRASRDQTDVFIAKGGLMSSSYTTVFAVPQPGNEVCAG